eukprot:symbB.v1.2.006050.t1/scaffold339.1/size225540/14
MKKRTGLKNEGLALLIRRSAFRDIEVQCEDLEPDFCDRVAMYAKITHLESGCRILVANTHLTVAHAENGHDIPFCRPRQMEQAEKSHHLSLREVMGAGAVTAKNPIVQKQILAKKKLKGTTVTPVVPLAPKPHEHGGDVDQNQDQSRLRPEHEVLNDSLRGSKLQLNTVEDEDEKGEADAKSEAAIVRAHIGRQA